jgi:DNA-binding MarR family transcriptional regulator
MSIDDEANTAVKEWIHLFMRNSSHSLMQFSRARGISMPQVGALFQIHRGLKAGVSRLSGELGVSSAAASQMLDKLVQQGLVIRNEDERDRRAKRVELTEVGRRVLEESIEAREEWVSTIIKRLTEEEKEEVRKTFTILTMKSREIEGGEACCVSQNF